jgi:hypothetical protein
MNYFGYNPGDVPEGAFKISPSQLSRFLDETGKWTREFLLGESGFEGNTASYLGSTVHGLAAMYKDLGSVDYQLAEAFIDSIETEGVDKDFIRQQYPVMYEALEREFLDSAVGTPELFLKKEIAPGVWLGGSIDLLNPEEVDDYKTTSALNAPTDVKRSYFFQQLCYVWLARQQGFNVRRFRLIYVTTNTVGRISEKTGKPMQDYPTKVSEVVYEVTDDDMIMIEGIIKLVADFVGAWKKHPELRHVLAQDYRLKVETPRVSIFKKHNEVSTDGS